MKAMVLRAPSDLALSDVALPEVPAGHVLVRITHSGLCGTDLKIYKGAIPAQYPLIMGHEMVGELAGGERVIIDPVLYCGTCFHCRHRTDQSLSCRRLDRARDQWRVRRIRGRPRSAGVSAAGFARSSDCAADPGGHHLLARAAAGERVAGRIGGGDRARRVRPIARANRQGARRGESDRDQPQQIQERSRAASWARTWRSNRALGP